MKGIDASPTVGKRSACERVWVRWSPSDSINSCSSTVAINSNSEVASWLLFCCGFYFLSCEFKPGFPSGGSPAGFPPAANRLPPSHPLRPAAAPLLLQASCHLPPQHPATDGSTTAISTWIHPRYIRAAGSLMSVLPRPAQHRAPGFSDCCQGNGFKSKPTHSPTFYQQSDLCCPTPTIPSFCFNRVN